MKQIINLFILVLLAGTYAPSFAAVSDVEMPSCSVFSDGDKKQGEEEEEEEEPDCE